jgi:hypothetical protein
MVEKRLGCGAHETAVWKNFTLSMPSGDLSAQSALVGSLADQIVMTLSTVNTDVCHDAMPKK